ncbi:MAG: aminomethyltransferase family protein [Sciscionella sp.]
MPTRHTPYHQRLVELGAEMGDRIGFDAAVAFTSTEHEHLATRTGVGLYDVYYQGPIDIKGPDAQALLDHVLARDVPRRLAADGQVLYASVCDEAGGMIDDLTAYRLAPEHYWLIATPSRAEVVERHATEQARDRRAYVTNTISGTAYLSVQGPGSRELLGPLTDADLSTEELPYFRCLETMVADVPTLVSRTGYSGELGYELYYPRDYALHMWDTLTGAGATLCGLGALRSTRMEKKFPLYGLDVSEATSPLEAGLGWAVDLDAAPFIGREALRRQRDDGVSRLLTGIELPDLSHVPAAGEVASDETGRQLGTLTSTDRGWSLGKALAMGYLPADLPPGSTVTLTAPDGTPAAGLTTHRPFYDPDGARVRA